MPILIALLLTVATLSAETSVQNIQGVLQIVVNRRTALVLNPYAEAIDSFTASWSKDHQAVAVIDKYPRVHTLWVAVKEKGAWIKVDESLWRNEINRRFANIPYTPHSEYFKVLGWEDHSLHIQYTVLWREGGQSLAIFTLKLNNTHGIRDWKEKHEY